MVYMDPPDPMSRAGLPQAVAELHRKMEEVVRTLRKQETGLRRLEADRALLEIAAEIQSPGEFIAALDVVGAELARATRELLALAAELEEMRARLSNQCQTEDSH